MPRRIPPELMAVAIVIAVLSELFPITAQCADSAADTTPRATGERRLAAYLDRLQRSTDVTIFQVDGWWPDCKPWTFPLNRVIDCRPIIQERPAPSRSWCDSLIQLLREPGAVSLPAPKPCLGRQDLGLRFIADAETIKVWLNGCGDGVLSGLPVAMGFDYTPVLARVRSMLLSPLPKVEYETVSSVRVPLEPPVLLSAPEPPRELEIAATGLADTVSFYAVVPKDGRVHAIFLTHSVARFDSLAAVYASKFLFRPALVGGKPATAYAWINIPVPKTERTTR